MRERQRERHRERQRETETERDREREGQRERQTDREREREREDGFHKVSSWLQFTSFSRNYYQTGGGGTHFVTGSHQPSDGSRQLAQFFACRPKIVDAWPVDVNRCEPV